MRINPSTVVVALSGGLDSSFAAARLIEAGWRVRGLHLVLPAPAEVLDARRKAVLEAAGFLDIEVEFLDLTQQFIDGVVSPFVSRYLKGLTPNPCVVCNERIKFPALCRYADTLDIPFVATGHYAGHERTGETIKLLRGSDPLKDQSYFLHRVDIRCLARTLFPIGTLTKEHCRNEALAIGLNAADFTESQEICFLQGTDYRRLVEHLGGQAATAPGQFVTESGEVLGNHQGIHRFTIGQRHGMGIASARPYYVKALRPERGDVVVGRREEIFSRDALALQFKWLRRPQSDVRFSAQIRYRHRAAPGLLRMEEQDQVRFIFDEPQWAVTPGQALVCYDGETVVGGGWISNQ
ncbi:MAG TPA: tRNA 2-thiouridine(34) synthase MnmA [Desulfobacteraceae bacterium]|nr:tRNA 2-thiouridine(34) synthase MnmA [Desulfobacteraceae bacterium]